MPRFSIDIDSRVVRTALRDLEQAASELEPALRDIGEALLLSHAERHDAGLAPDGTPWEPLKPSTWAGKRGRKPLFEEGDMLRLVYQVSGNELTFGTSDHKAAFHHFGTRPYVIRAKNRKALSWPGARHPVRSVRHPGLPARPIVGIGPDDEIEISEIVQEHLHRTITHRA